MTADTPPTVHPAIQQLDPLELPTPVEIRVVLVEEDGQPPRCEFRGPDRGAVTVDEHGNLHIDWPRGTERMDLSFVGEPTSLAIVSIQLGWAADQAESHPGAPSFTVRSGFGPGRRRHFLGLGLLRCLEVMDYTLTVDGPGGPHVLDPKIYNKGDDGVGGGGGRSGG